MPKEFLPIFNQPEALEQEKRETKPSSSYESSLKNLEAMKQEEFETLSESGNTIRREPNPVVKQKKMNRLAVYVLTSLIASGAAGETLQNTALAESLPEKETKKFVVDTKEIETARLRDYQSLEKIIQEGKIKEKIDFLRQQYGSAIDNFLSIHKIPKTLEFFEKTKNGMENNNTDILIKKDFPYGMTAGSILSNLTKEKWTNLTTEQKTEKSQISVEIEGFENASGLSNAVIQKYLENRPQFWRQGSTKSIEYMNKEKELAPGYAKAGETKIYSIATMLEKDSRQNINIYKLPRGYSENIIFTTIDHEMAHNNDWENSQVLSNQERVDLFYDIAMRYSSSDHFKSRYVESIKDKNGDKELELYVKTREYWATISEEYLKNPDQFKKYYEEDTALVEKWLGKINGSEN